MLLAHREQVVEEVLRCLGRWVYCLFQLHQTIEDFVCYQLVLRLVMLLLLLLLQQLVILLCLLIQSASKVSIKHVEHLVFYERVLLVYALTRMCLQSILHVLATVTVYWRRLTTHWCCVVRS